MDTLYKKLLLLTMAIVLGQSVAAQEKVSKTITEDFSMTNAGQLHLENKYGTVNLYGWDKDNISISVVITASHRKKQNAEDLLKRIRPVINDAENFVDELSIEIKSKDASNHEIYYSVDGTEPTSESKRYTEPVVITKDTEFKATIYVEKDGEKVAFVRSKMFKRIYPESEMAQVSQAVQ